MGVTHFASILPPKRLPLVLRTTPLGGVRPPKWLSGHGRGLASRAGNHSFVGLPCPAPSGRRLLTCCCQWRQTWRREGGCAEADGDEKGRAATYFPPGRQEGRRAAQRRWVERKQRKKAHQHALAGASKCTLWEASRGTQLATTT